jgi:hypothetical protein
MHQTHFPLPQKNFCKMDSPVKLHLIEPLFEWILLSKRLLKILKHHPDAPEHIFCCKYTI